jgi:GTP-binding protein EngB required for normal cell division
LLDRAGERLRLSDQHTVVALAGGTGSGKSSLFNRLAGANLSAVGVTRPVTRHPHACVWGAHGSGPLLDWLGVPRRFQYSRSSALDRAEDVLNGLVLVDLPDHDSVASGASGQVEKLVGMTDLMVWVLDPQKYADAAVHQRYLVPLAGHSGVIAVVLNQSDLLTETQIEECGVDLRRLLDSEGLQNAPLLVTSAHTGTGLDQLRTMLGNAVSQRRATGVRISADLDGIAEEFLPYAREQHGGTPPADGQDEFRVPASQAQDLEDQFVHAAGVSAVVDALESARELRAVDYIGWPVAWFAERITGRNPVRKIRLGRLWDEVKGIAAGPSGAQQAEIDSALTKLADVVGQPLPRPWSQTTRSALRSRSDQIPGALGAAMRSSLPPEDGVVGWWRAIGALQGLLLGCVIVGLAWVGALLAFGVFHAVNNVPRLFSNTSLLPWVIVLIAGLLLAGWVIAWASGGLVRKAAESERQHLQESIHDGVAAVAREMVFMPAEQELAEYRRFREELRIAVGA